jgi:Putative Ig domain
VGLRVRSCLIGLCAIAVTAAVTVGAAANPAPPRVTLIGDSVPDPIQYVPQALATISQGIDLNVQTTPCRKVDEESCPYRGVKAPNVIQLVQSLGSTLGPTVIVSVGYNDDPALYAGSIEHALDALRAAGVSRVLWVTLKVDRSSYASMNAAIESAASRHPELSVIDWDTVAQAHPEWFQADGLHLNDLGANAMADLFHDALTQIGIPVVTPPLRVTTSSLPRGRVGGAYTATLHAAGGTPPYRWSLTARAPRGLHLAAAGRLSGFPTSRGARTLTMRVTDSGGISRTVRLPIRIRAAN